MARPRVPDRLTVDNQAVGQVPIRVYREPAGEPSGTVVFLHGGAWTIGDLDSHDRACRRIALGTGAVVVAVDYRRAPEHPWPAAVDDAIAVIRWTAGRFGGPLAVMGDSSGGNLAALACLRLRPERLPDIQVLAYPNTDLTMSQPSIKEKGAGWGLDADFVAWGAENWVPDPARRADPGVSPLFAPDLSGLPATLIVTAEHDPLRDEGDTYAERLAVAGVPVRHRCEPRMVHGFLSLDTISPAAAAAGDRLIADIAESFTFRSS
jgi:acetyl esterase